MQRMPRSEVIHKPASAATAHRPPGSCACTVTDNLLSRIGSLEAEAA
ncbi:hypothetical protein ACFFRL_08960 [Agromyces hippuratus]